MKSHTHVYKHMEQSKSIEAFDSGDCPICLQTTTEGNLVTLRCGHVFHTQCVFSSLKKGHEKCCLCREQFIEQPSLPPGWTTKTAYLYAGPNGTRSQWSPPPEDGGESEDEEESEEESEGLGSIYTWRVRRINASSFLLRRGLALAKSGDALITLQAAVLRYKDARTNLQRVKRDAKKARVVLKKLQRGFNAHVTELTRNIDERIREQFRATFVINEGQTRLARYNFLRARSRVLCLTNRYYSMSIREARLKLEQERDAICIIAPAVRSWRNRVEGSTRRRRSHRISRR